MDFLTTQKTSLPPRRLLAAGAVAMLLWCPPARAADAFVSASASAGATASASGTGAPAAPPIAPGPPSPAPAKSIPATSGTTDDALFDLARELYETYAPEAIKEQYSFMSREQWREFVGQFEKKLETGSMEELAGLKPKVGRAAAVLRSDPAFSDYTDWLAERLDLIDSASEALRAEAAPRPFFHARTLPHPTPARPPPDGPGPAPGAVLFTMPPFPPAPRHTELFHLAPKMRPDEAVPYYNLWYNRMSKRAEPKNAAIFVPLLKEIFAAELVPPELVWIAEVESSFNPKALSPAGARGLFQLMPATARSLGLHLFPFDERLNAGKSARAAAQLLRHLHKRFGTWPLTLAAYNAGESRVAVALKKTPGAKDYDDICQKLPAETRLYVPKVLATLVVRGKVPLTKFIPTAPPPPLPAIHFPPPA